MNLIKVIAIYQGVSRLGNEYKDWMVDELGGRSNYFREIFEMDGYHSTEWKPLYYNGQRNPTINLDHPCQKFVPFITQQQVRANESQYLDKVVISLIDNWTVGKKYTIVGFDHDREYYLKVKSSSGSTHHMTANRLDDREIAILPNGHPFNNDLATIEQLINTELGNSSSDINTISGIGTSTTILTDTNGIVVTEAIPTVVNVDTTVKEKANPLHGLKPLRHNITNIQKELVKCLLYDPKNYRKYISKHDNPGYAASFIKSLLPYRIGLEFDVCGITRNKYPEEVQALFDKYHNNSKAILIETESNYSSNITDTFEWKYSFKGLHGLYKLKDLLEMLEKHNIKPVQGGGLHIHVDISPLVKEVHNLHSTNYVRRRYYDYLQEVYKYKHYIFNVFNIRKDLLNSVEYKKIVNKKSFLDVNTNRARICVHRRHDTIEWRLADSTFDFPQIVKWIIFTSMMTETVRNQSKKFNMDLYENIRRL